MSSLRMRLGLLIGFIMLVSLAPSSALQKLVNPRRALPPTPSICIR